MLSYLLYTSKSKLKNYQDVDHILLTANKFNTQHKITGILLFDDCYFLQILEGKKETIEALFNTIKQDNRHEDVQLKLVHNLKKRNFPDWSMRLSLTSKKSLEPIHQMRPIDHNDPENKATEMLALLGIVLSETFTEYNIEHVNNLDFKEFATLTNREHNVLKQVIKGEAIKDIAHDLNISPKTVSRHIENIKTKLNCNSSKEITKKTFDSGYIMYLI